MNYYKLRLLSFVTLVALGMLLTSVNAEESTRNRIQKHKEWLKRRTADKISAGYVETSDPLQKIRYFKKLIRFKNKDDVSSNEISFVPHLAETKDTIDGTSSGPNHNDDEATALIDTGNKFAYDTINNNAERVIVKIGDVTTEIGVEEANKATRTTQDVGEQSSPEPTTNIINENNEQQESAIDVSNDIKTQMEGSSKAHIGDVDTKSNRRLVGSTKPPAKSTSERPMGSPNEISAVANTSSTSTSEKGPSDFEIKRFISEHIKFKSNNVTIKKSWGKWSPWSGCSRSCGEGVMSQSRDCTEKMYKHGKRINISTIALNECIGFYKRFRICSETECPQSDVDFRAQQCTEFNNQSFRGQTYKWEPYIKDDAECDLNCRPVNQKYFARLREYAVDGTHCLKVHNPPKNNATFDRGVCVEGKCKAVLKSGVISGSGFMNSGNVRCGGSICRPISGVFAKNPLPNGYVHVTTIPAGASNFTITELRNSINFLALKATTGEYIINGNYTVSPSGPYEVAGTTIDYHRFDGNLKETHHQKRSDGVTEWITSSGPLFEPIHLMVLSQQTNPGIKYEYLLPTSLATSEEGSEVDYFSSGEDNLPLNYKLKAANSQTNVTSAGRKKRKFTWKVIGFTPCSKSCGGGSQQPIIRCVRGEPTRAYSPKKCAHMKKPIVNESLMKCNSAPCAAFWKLGEWSSCRCGEFDEKTNETREVKCVQELISGVVIQVNSGACIDDRPLSILQCECVKPTKPPKHEIYKHSRQSIIKNTQSDQKTNPKVRTKPPKSKRAGSWLISEWSEQCSSECGVGQQFRTIFCDRSPPNIERCDIQLTPNTYRECTSNARCIGEWFIGPWSLCSGDCFNASRSRTVVCIKNDGFAEESECDLKAKPTTFEDCKPEEMKDCKPKWHSSEWSECNKNCGSGIQRRIIKCLESDAKENVLRESSKCKYSERPAGMRYCNTHDCSEKTTTYDPRIDMIQNDDDPNCRDEFPNCNMVLKSKLCGYAYYNENCCQSCRMISNELF